MVVKAAQKHRRHQADLWSVGAIAFELVAAKPPFTGANHVQLLRNIESRAPKHPPSTSVELSHLLRGLLERDPVHRMCFDDFFHHPFLSRPHATGNSVDEQPYIAPAFRNPAVPLSIASSCGAVDRTAGVSIPPPLKAMARVPSAVADVTPSWRSLPSSPAISASSALPPRLDGPFGANFALSTGHHGASGGGWYCSSAPCCALVHVHACASLCRGRPA